MNNLNRLLLPGLSVALVLSLIAQRGSGQGSITPGSAPTVPIMRTLSEVEPRIPIPAGSSYTISSAGNYYLTGNLTNSSTPALTITASQVTVDLNGYTVSSSGGVGIFTNGSGISLLEIKNGLVRGGTVGIQLNVSSFSPVRSIALKNLRITDASLAGIQVTSSATGITISDCLVTNIGPTSNSDQVCGISAWPGTVVERCVVDKVLSSSSTKAIGINLATTGAFAIGNKVSNCAIGIQYGKVQNNLTYGCATAFSGTIDAGGNN